MMPSSSHCAPVMLPAPPEGVVNVGNEWYYSEYPQGSGVSSLGTGGAAARAPATASPAARAPSTPAEERRSILDLFRN